MVEANTITSTDLDEPENRTMNCSGRNYIQLSYTASYVAVTCVLIICMSALFISTVIYFVQKHGRQQRLGNDSSKKRLDLMVLVVSFSVTVSTFINISRFTSNCFHYYAYSSINLSEIPFVTVGYTGVYAVIWYRVWLIINHPVMAHMRNRIYNAGLIITIVLISVTGCANFIAYIYTNTPAYILLHNREITEKTDRLRYLTFSISVGAHQVILLGMFSYPLLKYHFQSKRTKSHRKSITLLARTAVTSALCGSTDLLFFLAYFFAVKPHVSKRYAEFLVALTYDINLILNVVFLLLSFSDWKIRFFPCVKKQTFKRQQSMSVIKRSTNRNIAADG